MGVGDPELYNGNSRGLGGSLQTPKNGNSRGVGGPKKIPPVEGVRIFSGTTHCHILLSICPVKAKPRSFSKSVMLSCSISILR